ncbi:hypothetical protein BC938DRAFT_481896 [Jimgerdemannia flammicorona]|uniref:Ubiquitin-like modifier HUB1 n=1 Tax=Jimgerdemannia flammicorona TaxID=994334 RepID=A0A433QF82_9FUNG|nr:hypothetical protein BC938DRAFT_481896 [Jimgerdemannia flammicorona]
MADRQTSVALKSRGVLIELEVNDRLGKKVRVKCRILFGCQSAYAHTPPSPWACFLTSSPKDTVGDFKKLVAAQIGTEPSKIVLKKWYKEFRDHITLEDCEYISFATHDQATIHFPTLTLLSNIYILVCV